MERREKTKCLVCGVELEVSWDVVSGNGPDLTFGAFPNETWKFNDVKGGKNIGHFKGCNTAHFVCSECFSRPDCKVLLLQALHDHHAEYDLQGVDNNFYPLTSDESVRKRILSASKLVRDIDENFYKGGSLKIGNYIHLKGPRYLKVVRLFGSNKYVVEIVE